MTLRTVTYDDSTHKLVPLEPTEKQLDVFDDWCQGRELTMSWTTLARVLNRLIAAAPEYQDKIADLESQDFYEVMQAYRHEQLHVARRFEFVKQWLRNPAYEYQDTKKDE